VYERNPSAVGERGGIQKGEDPSIVERGSVQSKMLEPAHHATASLKEKKLRQNSKRDTVFQRTNNKNEAGDLLFGPWERRAR